MNAQRVSEIIGSYDADRTASLAILQDIQREYNFLPREALELVAQHLGVPVGHVYQMATFFKAFSLAPKGEHICKVCLGTACHVKGGALILETLEKELKIKSGQTSPDGKVSLEGVRCMGACALAPIVVVDDQPHGQVTTDQAVKLVNDAKARTAGPSTPAAQSAAVVAPRGGVDLSAVPPR
jgi:NADH:ubiquinone oxidoreductase subunit E